MCWHRLGAHAASKPLLRLCVCCTGVRGRGAVAAPGLGHPAPVTGAGSQNLRSSLRADGSALHPIPGLSWPPMLSHCRRRMLQSSQPLPHHCQWHPLTAVGWHSHDTGRRPLADQRAWPHSCLTVARYACTQQRTAEGVGRPFLKPRQRQWPKSGWARLLDGPGADRCQHGRSSWGRRLGAAAAERRHSQGLSTSTWSAPLRQDGLGTAPAEARPEGGRLRR